jgi:glutamate N-acetyltransferase/amino-acid N-acetyltransferase
MNANLKKISGSIVAPRGFRASGVFCDIKRLGTGKGSEKGQKRDLALLVSECPAAVAGMFTTNQVCAAPVKVSMARMRQGRAQAIVINSGNANACTGKQGFKDALEMVTFVEHALKLPRGTALIGSTGRIGLMLPMDNVRAGIVEAAVDLGSTTRHANSAAEAIITSDTRTKQIAVECKIGNKPVRIGGFCKGAGMIQPGMSSTGARPAAVPLHATMLCFITTDCAIEQGTLQRLLQEAVAKSFNRITVDGDMSTNDTVLVLANGLAGNPLLKGTSGSQSNASSRAKDLARFEDALSYVCLELAKMIVRDGEGVSRFVTVRVSGAKSFGDADSAARAVANSALVKTSWHGGDPNWGRIIDALGYSAARIVEKKVDIGYSLPGQQSVLWSLKRGQPTSASFKDLCRIAAKPEFDLHVSLNLGSASALIYAADLTEQYVEFNKGDVSDPSSLGG